MWWKADGLVFVPGQLATDPDKVMDNLRRVLQGIGLDFTNVICGRIFLTQFEPD